MHYTSCSGTFFKKASEDCSGKASWRIRRVQNVTNNGEITYLLRFALQYGTECVSRFSVFQTLYTVFIYTVYGLSLSIPVINLSILFLASTNWGRGCEQSI